MKISKMKRNLDLSKLSSPIRRIRSPFSSSFSCSHAPQISYLSDPLLIPGLLKDTSPKGTIQSLAQLSEFLLPIAAFRLMPAHPHLSRLSSASKRASYSLAVHLVLRAVIWTNGFLDLHNIMWVYSPLSFLFSYAVSDTESMTDPYYRGQFLVFITPLICNLWRSPQYSPPRLARRRHRAGVLWHPTYCSRCRRCSRKVRIKRRLSLSSPVLAL
jgi:hypothetical protein